MLKNKLLITATCFTLLGLLLASCAPAVTPAASPKLAAVPAATATTAPAAPKPAATQTPVSPTPAARAAEPAATPKPGADQPKYGGTLSISYYTDIASLDVHQEPSGSVLMVVSPGYSGLVQYSPLEVQKIIPDLAEKWEVSPDGKAYTFHLRQGVKWHDGAPFSAEDVRFSLDRIRKPPQGTRSPRASLLKGIAQIDIPEQNTVTVRLDSVSAAFLSTMASAWEKMVPRHAVQAKGDLKSSIVGTGPFKLKSYSSGVIYEFVKNQDYFMKGQPYVDGVTFYVIRDLASRFAAFRTHRVNMTSQSNGLTPSQADVVKKTMPDASVGQSEAGNWWNFFMNLNRPPWNDIRVRQAVSLAIDRQQAIKIVDEGWGELGLFMPPGPWAKPDAAISSLPGYRQPKDADRTEARRLLTEAGYPDGFRTTIMVRSGAYYENGAVFIKDQLATIGIKGDIDIRDQTVAFERQQRLDFDSTYFKEGLDVGEPTSVLVDRYMSDSGRNYSGIKDKTLDDLLDKQDMTLDEAKRKEIVLQAQDRLQELLPVAITHWGVYLVGWWKEVRGFNAAVGRYSNSTYVNVWLAR